VGYVENCGFLGYRQIIIIAGAMLVKDAFMVMGIRNAVQSVDRNIIIKVRRNMKVKLSDHIMKHVYQAIREWSQQNKNASLIDIAQQLSSVGVKLREMSYNTEEEYKRGMGRVINTVYSDGD
jgi:NADH:ubiquinone oxidoreductase subunit 6 (subunit J)